MSYSVLRKPGNDVAKPGRLSGDVARVPAATFGTSRGADTADGGSVPNQRIAPPGAGVLINEKRMKAGGEGDRILVRVLLN